MHPVDARYAQLGTTLTPIDVGSDLHGLLAQYLKNTHAATHASYSLELTQAFEVQRAGEAPAFRDIGNRQLLWHGSRLTNWCGILSQGLRIAPPEAPATGYMFVRADPTRTSSAAWPSRSPFCNAEQGTHAHPACDPLNATR